MTLNEARDRYLNHLVSMGRSPGTLKAHQCAIRPFFQYLETLHVHDIREIKKTDLYDYQILLLNRDYAHASLSHHVAFLRGFFGYLRDSHILLINPAENLICPKGRKSLPKPVLTENEMRHLLTLPDTNTKLGLRDRAIMELLYSSGIRRSELAGLNLYDIRFQDQEIRVKGKGSKERIAPFGRHAKHWMLKYLKEVRSKTLTNDPAFFLSQKTGSHRLHASNISRLLKRYIEKSRIGKPVSTHSFRHAFATHLLAHGAGIRYIQALLGHSDLETTTIYTRVEILDLEAEYKRTHPRAKKTNFK